MKKRFAAVILVLIMIAALVGCGANKRQPIELTLSTEDAEAILAAAGITLPPAEEVAAANTTIQWFAWFDDFHNYSEGEVVNTGFFTFREKYGCEIEWIECTWDERFTRVATLLVGGTPPDFMNGETENFPFYATQKTFQPINDYIDLTDPLWEGVADYMNTYFSLGGNVYMICTDRYFGSVLAYNRRIFDEWGFDDPAELYYNNEWTWDEFEDMAKDFSSEDNDRFALDGWFYTKGFQHSCGTPLVTYDLETGKYVSNIDDPRLERVNDFLYDLNKNGCIYPWYNHGYAVRDNNEFGGGLKSGNLLFSCGGPYFFTGPVEEISAEYADVTANELMFVPFPRDPSGDGTQYIESDPAGYCIVQNAPNPEGVALLAMCDRFKVLDPTVMSIDRKQKIEKYLWTDEMLDMYDLCVEKANSGDIVLAFEPESFSSNLGQVLDDIEKSAMQSNATTWAQIKEANGDQLQYYLDDFNARVDEYIASLG